MKLTDKIFLDTKVMAGALFCEEKSSQPDFVPIGKDLGAGSRVPDFVHIRLNR